MVREFLFILTMEEQLELSDKSKVALDIKAIIGMVVGIVSILPSLFSTVTLSKYPFTMSSGSNPIIDVSANSSGPVSDSNRNECE